MNTKKCIYRNCGNLSTTVPKLTFFSFPLKDVAKCKLWSQMAGCENVNLKHQFLCENHFNTIYVSNTPRRTVLLPNAVPYRWDENIDGNKEDGQHYEDSDGAGEYNLEEKQISAAADAHDEALLEPLTRGEDENDLIYTDDDQRQQQNNSIELLDVDAMVEDDEEGEHGNELSIINANTKSQKHNAGAVAPGQASAPTPNLVKIGGKRVMMLQQAQREQKHRLSLQSPGEFMSHVTKRQKINKNRSSADQQHQHKISGMDSKKPLERGYSNGEARIGGGNDDGDDNAGTGGNTKHIGKAAAATAQECDIPIDDTTNHPDIATFILKGEEFIQMPKRIYLAQRAQFIAELKRYRDIIHNIKHQVNSIN